MSKSLPDLLSTLVEQLPAVDHPQFASSFDFLGKTQPKVILIGDSSHGTSEFYQARARITQNLIEKYGFNMVAIEGDWPDARSIDKYVRPTEFSRVLHERPSDPTSVAPELPTTHHPLRDAQVFNRFPRWMWRNKEVESFIQWLKSFNASERSSTDSHTNTRDCRAQDRDARVSVHGLDLYSLGASIEAVISYLGRVDPEIATAARERYACLQPWVEDPAQYGKMAWCKGYAPCEEGVIRTLKDLLSKRLSLLLSDAAKDGSLPPRDITDSFFDAEMNARLVRDSERYYRAMYHGSAESWNLRDQHMFDTLLRLLQSRSDAKVIVWAHNSHLGDARATSMSKDRGELNLGQLCREYFASRGRLDDVLIVGCGTHGGKGSTVAAASEWDAPMEMMAVNPSLPNSVERLMHDTGVSSFVLDLRKGYLDEGIRRALMEPKLERFIGVIYLPETERWSHYMKASLARQFDVWLWFDRTKAIEPFEFNQPEENESVEPTYPFAM